MVNKILITSNPMNHEGGVVNYYRIFFKKFKSDDFELVHQTFGSRMKYYYSPVKKVILYPVYYFADFLQYFWRLLTDRQIRIVQVNPSLITFSLIREALIVLSAKLMGRKTIVFFRGWRDHIVQQLKQNKFAHWFFFHIYSNADLTLVLASRFKDDLVALGWDPSLVQVTTTLYEAGQIMPSVKRAGQQPRFLYLGRISELKGINELIDAAKILSEKGYDFKFLMVGHGDQSNILDTYKDRVKEYGLAKRFHFTGRLTGRDKYQAYADSDIYVFPSWTEGCPNSVLEALGAGLFIISTDVGALKDIIREGENGRIVCRKNAIDLSEKLVDACKNIEEIRTYRERIQNDARNLYDVDIILHKFKKIYTRLLDGNVLKDN